MSREGQPSVASRLILIRQAEVTRATAAWLASRERKTEQPASSEQVRFTIAARPTAAIQSRVRAERERRALADLERAISALRYLENRFGPNPA